MITSGPSGHLHCSCNIDIYIFSSLTVISLRKRELIILLLNFFIYVCLALFVGVQSSLPLSAMGWSVLVAFSDKIHLSQFKFSYILNTLNTLPY